MYEGTRDVRFVLSPYSRNGLIEDQSIDDLGRLYALIQADPYLQ